MLDPEALRTQLDAIAAQVEELRAGADLADDGDPSALVELRSTVDEMAENVAQLRVLVGGAPFAGGE